MEQAYFYARVSTVQQVAGDGISRQREAVARYAKANGYTIDREFLEEGVSGCTEGFERPALAELFEAVKVEGVNTVIVERIDRVSRQMLAGEVILAEFRKLGVNVIAAETGESLTDTNSPDKTLVQQIMLAIAAFDRSVIVAKLRGARNRRSAEAGRRIEGRKAFGARDGEVAVVDRIMQLHRKPKGMPRLSYGAIADRLNQDGLKTRTGAPWHAQTIYNIVNRKAA